MRSLALWIAGATALAAASSGVTSFSDPFATPYATPVVEKPTDNDDGAFAGLLDLAKSASPTDVVRVLWIHGMCTHPSSWIDERVDRLARMANSQHKTVGVRPVGGHGASLRTDRVSTAGATIELMFLNWSPLTARYKQALSFDHSLDYGGLFPYIRATLNRELKRGLINDCFTDVVVYGGPNGNPIRRAVAEAVCDAMGGHSDGSNCDVMAGDVPAALAFVTESLGSKLLIDAVLEIGEAVEGSGDDRAIKRLSRAIVATKTIYLVSNQVPLLDAAGSIKQEGSWAALPQHRMATDLLDVFALLARARERVPSSHHRMTVVAFPDPNDLLSYRLIPSHHGHKDEHFRIINVILSNDATYFGYVERPDTAHCGYSWNAHVFSMLANGYRPGRPSSIPSDWSDGSCIGAVGVVGP